MWTYAGVLAIVACASAVTRDQFYPYGPGLDQNLPRGSEVPSPELTLKVPIRFYGESYESVFINNFGVISFRADIPSFLNIEFPLPYPSIAAFYTNIDTTDSGSVYYRETDEPHVLSKAEESVQNNFHDYYDFKPTSVFIATWADVTYTSSEPNLPRNSFQIAVISNGTESFTELLFPERDIQWYQKASLDSGLPDAKAQSGFISEDGRIYALRGSGSHQIRNIVSWTNTHEPGKYVFRIGNILPEANVAVPDQYNQYEVEIEEESKTCAQSGPSVCHTEARCVDYPAGICCQCKDGYYGNGKSCIKNNIPLRVHGKINGVLNNVNLNDVDIQAYVVVGEGRAYTALSLVPNELGSRLQLLNVLGGVIGWLFAQPAGSAKNGYQLTGSSFNHSADVWFPASGDRVMINQEYLGHDVFDQITLETDVRGSIPRVATNSKLEITDYDEQYTIVEPGVIRSESRRTFTDKFTGEKIEQRVSQTFTFSACRFAPPSPEDNTPSTLKVNKNYLGFENSQNIVRYGMTNKIFPLGQEDPCIKGRSTCGPHSTCVAQGIAFACVCQSGFTGIYQDDLLTCIDIDECKAGTHNCDHNADCYNHAGGYQCRCREGFTGNGVSCNPLSTCYNKRCDVNAHCIDNPGREASCICNTGFYGDGQFCLPAEEDSPPDSEAEYNNTFVLPECDQHSCSCPPGYSEYTDSVNNQLCRLNTYEASSQGNYSPERTEPPYHPPTERYNQPEPERPYTPSTEPPYQTPEPSHQVSGESIYQQNNYDQSPDNYEQNNYNQNTDKNFPPYNFDQNADNNYDPNSENNNDLNSENNYDQNSENNYNPDSENNYNQNSDNNYNQNSDNNYNQNSDNNYNQNSENNYNPNSENNYNPNSENNYNPNSENNDNQNSDNNYNQNSDNNYNQNSDNNYNPNSENNYNPNSDNNDNQNSENNYNQNAENNFNPNSEDTYQQNNYDQNSDTSYQQPNESKSQESPDNNYQSQYENNNQESAQNNFEQQSYPGPWGNGYPSSENNYGQQSENNYPQTSDSSYEQPPPTEYKPSYSQTFYSSTSPASVEYHEPTDESLITCEEDAQCPPNALCSFLASDGSNEGLGHCVCPEGYEGDAFECIERSGPNCACGASAHCVSTRGDDYICVCDMGYHGDGYVCRPNFSCKNNSDCEYNAECRPDTKTNEYICQCVQGFIKDQNDACIPDTPLCNGAWCAEHATCLYDSELTLNYCHCNEGYSGDGISQCVLAGQTCDVTNDCSINALCTPVDNTYQCICRDGFNGDGYNCIPDATCRNDPNLCDLHASCLKRHDVYICECNTGYSGNGSYCNLNPRQTGNFLVASDGASVYRVPFRVTSRDFATPFNSGISQIAVGIDVDCALGSIYWGDVVSYAIKTSRYDGSGFDTFLSDGVKSPEGIAIDWSARNIFWTDSKKLTIEVANLDTKARKVLFAIKDISNPRGIAVHPQRGKIFWSDWKRTDPKIEWASMDGSQRGIFLDKTDVILPNSLAIDWVRDRLCYADAGLFSIKCVSLDTLEKETIATNCSYPFGLAIHGNKFYWTDWKTLNIESIDVETKARGQVPVSTASRRLYGVAVAPDQCPPVHSVCMFRNGGCNADQLCLPDGNSGRTCVDADTTFSRRRR